MEIRDAVERFKAWVHWKNMYEVVDADFLTDLNAILDIAQRYLSASSVMPSKPTGSEVNEDGQPISDVWVEGYNSAIDDCTLSLMKKCEGLEEKLFWHIDNMIMNIPEEKRIDCAGYISKGLSSAIQQYFQSYLKGSGR